MLNGKVSNRGQVLIIFVFAIIGLIGIAGLAIDGGNIYSNRREAQNVADAAALAAAVTKVNLQDAGQTGCSDVATPSYCGGLVKDAAVHKADDNNFSPDIVNQTMEVHIPPIDGAYSNCASYSFNCNDYVQVIIYTNVNTFFARVLGIGQLHNRVEAVALAEYKAQQTLYGGNALVALNPHSSSCYGDVYFGGSGTITLTNGNVFVNSDNPTCAFKMTNTCPTITLNNAILNGVGGQSNGCGQPPYTSGQTAVPYPPDPLFALGSGFPPPECNITPPASYQDANGFWHYGAGHYTSLPPDKNTVLDNGVFCVDNMVKTTNPTTLKNGPPPSGTDIGGVFIYIKPGGSFNFQGGVVNLSAPTSGMFKGLLLYVDESAQNWWTTAPNCVINGSSSMLFNGVIYAPHCDVQINGGSTPVGFTAQIVGFTIDLEGSANLNFIYNSNSAFVVPKIEWTGLYR